MKITKPTVESVKIDFPDAIISVNGTIIEKETVEKMIEALIDMLLIAKAEKWHISSTGRQIVYKEAVKALTKAGCTYE